jgi:hypothetical protein
MYVSVLIIIPIFFDNNLLNKKSCYATPARGPMSTFGVEIPTFLTLHPS